jgi:hypothetical protein
MQISSRNVLPLITVERTHQNLHLGKIFSLSFYVTLTDGQYGRLLIDTKSKYQHLSKVVSANGPAIFTLWESAVASSTAGAVTPINKNRIPSRGETPVMKCWSTVGITSNGTSLQTILVLGNTGGTSIFTNTPAGAGVRGRLSGWILNKETNYVLAIMNTAGTNIHVDYSIETIEED